jgi:hypothetical protein
METTAERYQRNADATGHAPDCRRRIVPGSGGDARALDPDRCERCRYVLGTLDAARKRREERRNAGA